MGKHVHPDVISGLVRAEHRPINRFELADLERQCEAAASSAQERQRSLRDQIAKPLILGSGLYIALWLALMLAGHDDLNKPFVSTMAGASAAIGISAWETRRSKNSISRVRAKWEQAIVDAKVNPVEQIDIAPLQAWSCDRGWIFDLGGSVGMFADFDIPGGVPRVLLTWRKAHGCTAWIDQSGAEIPRAAAIVPPLPSTHPLCRSRGPSVFSLDSADPGGSLLRFENGQFPLGAGSQVDPGRVAVRDIRIKRAQGQCKARGSYG